MDPDFADFLLDESHLDLKQKTVDDADFLEGLKITDNDEEEFLLTLDFESEPRQKMQGVEFDIPFEITSEDLDLLEAQEKAIIKQNDAKSSNTPKKQTRRLSSTTGNKENKPQNTNVNGSEVNKLKVDLELYRDRAESLSNELNTQKRQILTKEGEITILRQRLVQLDNEKIIMAQKYSELTESNRKAIEKTEEKWQKKMEFLKNELFFKEQELKSLSSTTKRKVPKTNEIFEHANFETFGTIRNDSPIPNTTQNSYNSSPKHIQSHFVMNDLELFTSFIRSIDLNWKFSELKEFDVVDIIKAREFACEEIRKVSEQCAKSDSGKALAHGMVKFFERALHFRQPVLLTYFSRLASQIFNNYGDRLKTEILEIRSQNGSVIFFDQICKLLTGRVIIDGIPKEIILNFLLILNIIIYQSDMKVPNELKPIATGGFLQWILRWDKFTTDEIVLIGKTLYSISFDLSIANAFLSDKTDKIEKRSVLDLLLIQAEDLIETLFPRGRIYRSRFGSQLPLLEDELDRLKRADVILSLIFSFVIRSMGPVELWIPVKLIQPLVIWVIDVLDHDFNTLESLEFLPPKILIAQESLLDTIFSGLVPVWQFEKYCMPVILGETRIPLLYALQQVSNHMSSFGGAVKSASELAKIIDREVSDDIKAVYETGHLPRIESDQENN